MKTRIQPAQFVPVSPADFVGPAAKVARILEAKATAMRAARNGTVKLLLFGPPGTGKTALAEYFARQLAGHGTCIESTNGRNVDLAAVRQWQQATRYKPLFGLFNVKIVNELDTCPPASQDLLLTYLDEMPDCTAFIGTSNLDLRQLVERFQSRLQQFKVGTPEGEDIHRLLARLKVPKVRIPEIVLGCGGNVRAALLDAQSIIDTQLAA